MHPTWPSLRAQARPGALARAISCRCGRPCRGHNGHVVGPQPCRVVGQAAVSWPCAARRHGRVMACLATRCLAASSPSWSQYTIMYCDIVSPAASPCWSQYTAVHCDTNPSHPATSVTIQFVYCNPNPCQVSCSCHNTPSVL